MFAEEFFPKRVADEVEGVGADVGEDFMGELGGVNIENITADDVIGGDSKGTGFCIGRLEVPEFGRINN